MNANLAPLIRNNSYIINQTNKIHDSQNKTFTNTCIQTYFVSAHDNDHATNSMETKQFTIIDSHEYTADIITIL